MLPLHQRPIFLSQLFMYILYNKFIKNAMLNLRFELRHKQGLSLFPLPFGVVKQIVFIHI